MGWCEKCENFNTDFDTKKCGACKLSNVDGHAPTNFRAKADNVNHPSHYETGKFECIEVMVETQGVEAVKNFCLCNAFKYLWRHNGKEKEVSIDKALWYLNKYVELRDEKNVGV